MSNIIRHLKCDHCGAKFDNIYISFGRNQYCFDFKWKCDKCQEIVTTHIHAYMWFGTCHHKPDGEDKVSMG
jgi:hypothetical protein